VRREGRGARLALEPPAAFRTFHNREALKEDYRDMQTMLFGSVPTFHDIQRGLTELERRINAP